MKTKNSPGRPKYVPVIPKSRFTMTDFMVANGVNLETGKGKNCSKLTLIKFLARDAKRKGHSTVVRLKDITAEPNSKDGLGRKALVYQLRTKFEASKAKASAAPAKKVTDKAVKTAAENYETTKAAILAPVAEIVPTPAAVVAETVPEPTPAPTAEATQSPEVPAESAAQ